MVDRILRWFGTSGLLAVRRVVPHPRDQHEKCLGPYQGVNAGGARAGWEGSGCGRLDALFEVLENFLMTAWSSIQAMA